MIHFIAYMQALERTAEYARGALPDAPVRPDSPARLARRSVEMRPRLALALRSLADRVQPVPADGPSSRWCDDVG
jgi:hypothetical protein